MGKLVGDSVGSWPTFFTTLTSTAYILRFAALVSGRWNHSPLLRIEQSCESWLTIQESPANSWLVNWRNCNWRGPRRWAGTGMRHANTIRISLRGGKTPTRRPHSAASQGRVRKAAI